MSDLYVSWSDYHQKIEQLAAQLYRSDWQFNQIVCIAKGGLRVGDVLCRLYHYPLAVMSASSYQGEGNRQRGQIRFSDHLSMTTETLGDRVLVVDDLADSGVSLRESKQWLLDHYGDTIRDIRTAVLWYKSCSVFKPDYYVDYLSDNPWIHQPFEYYEATPIAEIAAKYEGAISTN
ncbi:phosphoribosyltransferase [Spirulina major]|uniref:phosphoribosyltransferase n=1 Tax=Spirulina major TaxID=270636 RepID=UPI0009340B42|nr:phosphoribosyltransferase family protein [Spirulina major]